MQVAIVIGCYRMLSFIELGILRWRRLLPEVPILLSDDRSSESDKIRALAEKHGCDYTCPERRRSHFSGDMQSFINGIVFARELGADVIIKSSQRVIPVHQELLKPMFEAFNDPECKVVLPGQLSRGQIARPTARFYARFGVLTDLVAMRSDAIEPDELLSVYRERNKGKPSDSFSETSFGFLIANKFRGRGHKLLDAWTHHQPGRPKLYLRKSQSSASDYHQISLMEGIRFDDCDLREWIQIEKGYKPKADIV